MGIEDDRKISVVNRSGNGLVVYRIPDMGNLRREFQDGEEKIITFEELKKLSYIPGGDVLLKEYLIINDKQVLEELGYHPEPEYFYTREDIINIMQTGSLDEFLDCLDFAPEGVKTSIKKIAVELPLNDVAKRKAIEEKLGFNVDNAVRNKEIVEQEEEEERPGRSRRRAAVPSNTSQGQQKNPSPSRRVTKN